MATGILQFVLMREILWSANVAVDIYKSVTKSNLKAMFSNFKNQGLEKEKDFVNAKSLVVHTKFKV